MSRRRLGMLVLLLLLLGTGSLAALWATAARRPPAPAPDGGPRIVALSPAVAVILRDLGLADRIVGRHGYDFVLNKSVPVCGDQAGGIDYETLLRARPTHVLIESGARETPGRLTELAEEHHWAVESLRMLTLDDIEHTARRLGETFVIGRG